jgi:Glycosyl hydrolase family 26
MSETARGPGVSAAWQHIRTAGTAVVAGTQHYGRHRRASSRPRNRFHQFWAIPAAFGNRDQNAARVRPPPRSDRRTGQTKLARILVIGATAIAVAASALVSSFRDGPLAPAAPPAAAHHKPGTLLGVFVPGVPQSYSGVRAFTAATQVRPKLVVYYSGWLEPFQVRFALVAARNGAAPLVQIDPTGVSLAAIASGQYDAYLRSYASSVRAFGRQVVLSFAPEMNGTWYAWGYKHTSPAVFVAAWRHIVTIFRVAGAKNVTWLWTVNVIDKRQRIPSPARWWPGSSYVDWVGIDGYYQDSSWKFAALFGPTIKAVRTLTLGPILISETAATISAGQPAKIADLFAGIRAYGLLGFVWFNHNRNGTWRLSSPAAIDAFRRGAESLKGYAS